jgi:geranylgeranyl diphosphate synthase type II
MDKQLQSYLENKKNIINKALDRYLYKPGKYPALVHQAMRYSVFSGGKRLRAILVNAAFYVCSSGKVNPKQREAMLAAASAVEMIHASSLIHDDLPAIDNDDCRRGKPSCHRKYNEAIAIVAGDALLIRAFEVLAGTGDCRLVKELAAASGTMGMIGGQVVDIEGLGRNEKKEKTIKKLDYVHLFKTAALIRVSLRLGAIVAGASAKKIHALDAYGRNIGRVFQITDDIIDYGTDRGINYPDVYGLVKSKEKVRKLTEKAFKALEIIGPKAIILKQLAQYLVDRKA